MSEVEEAVLCSVIYQSAKGAPGALCRTRLRMQFFPLTWPGESAGTSPQSPQWQKEVARLVSKTPGIVSFRQVHTTTITSSAMVAFTSWVKSLRPTNVSDGSCRLRADVQGVYCKRFSIGGSPSRESGSARRPFRHGHGPSSLPCVRTSRTAT